MQKEYFSLTSQLLPLSHIRIARVWLQINMKDQTVSILVCLGLLLVSCSSLDILSFNIRQFGKTKYSKQNVVNVLIKILENYDLIIILELVDSSNTVLPGFVKQLNQSVEDKGFMFNYTVSERVGRSNYKEQYTVIYRTDVIRVLDTFQYDDVSDYFERPPFSVLVHSTNEESRGIPPFFLVASHTKPTDTANEIDGLEDVYNAASRYFSTSAGMILGDLNADCTYLSNTRYNTLSLILNTSFTWWIDKEVDTTTGNTHCAYDRIITSSSLTPYVVNGSVDVVLFDERYNLTSTFTAEVSDHYPVTVTLEGSSGAATIHKSLWTTILTFSILSWNFIF